MNLLNNKQGVTATFIILFGLLALSVVLLDGISISIRQKKEIQAITQQARNYCYKPHEPLPGECPITQVWRCDENFILRSDCLGVGDVILNAQADFAKWCGYTAFGEPSGDCGIYWLDNNKQDCLKSQNLCKK